MEYIESAAIRTQPVTITGLDYTFCKRGIEEFIEQGFICVWTNEHFNGSRFVTQEAALAIAIAVGQRISLHDNHTKLSPEDIKDDPLFKG